MADVRYWDTASFIAVLNEEEGRVATCQAILDQAENEEVELWTSAFTLAEVLWPKGQAEVKAKMAENRKLVRDFFKRSPLKLVQVDRWVGELAQEVVWEHNVKPKDAIHVASAILAETAVLETYDSGLLDLKKIQGVDIRKPLFKGDAQYRMPDTPTDLTAEND